MEEKGFLNNFQIGAVPPPQCARKRRSFFSPADGFPALRTDRPFVLYERACVHVSALG